MATLYRQNKNKTATYIVDSESHYDKNKKQDRSKRRYSGMKLDKDGNIVPCRKYNKTGKYSKKNKKTNSSEIVNTCSSIVEKETLINKEYKYGAYYLLHSIVDQLGIETDLEKIFPFDYKQILSIVYFLIIEENTALHNFKYFHYECIHPYGEDIPSPRSTELFKSITSEQIYSFFETLKKFVKNGDILFYDGTNETTYSKNLEADYGKSKSGERLPQINLFYLVSKATGLPVYYRQVNGRIVDVQTVKMLNVELGDMGYSNITFEMDRGFTSQENLIDMDKNGYQFIVGGKTNVNTVKEKIVNLNDIIDKNFENRIDDNLYCVKREIDYNNLANNVTGYKPNKPLYAYIYYDLDKRNAEINEFHALLNELKEELSDNKKYKSSNEKTYKKYFIINRDADNKIVSFENNTLAIEEETKSFGYFYLLTNCSDFTALELHTTYRERDSVEKRIDDLKNLLNNNRLLCSSDLSLNGKLFVSFVSLIVVSELRQRIRKSKACKKYTFMQLLKELNKIKCFIKKDGQYVVKEVLRSQNNLLKELKIEIFK